MATLEVTEEQLHIIQRALDMYSRIGILQLRMILEHPTIEKLLTDKHTLMLGEPLMVGDETVRGEVVEVGDGYVKTKGSWGNGEEIKEWEDVDNIRRSPDYSKLHSNEDYIKKMLEDIKYDLSSGHLTSNASYGIYNQSDVDETCRIAYDIIQVIRHEFWLNDPNRSAHTVDSSIMLTTKDCHKIRVTL